MPTSEATGTRPRPDRVFRNAARVGHRARTKARGTSRTRTCPDSSTSASKFLAVRSTAPACAPSTRPMRAMAIVNLHDSQRPVVAGTRGTMTSNADGGQSSGSRGAHVETPRAVESSTMRCPKTIAASTRVSRAREVRGRVPLSAEIPRIVGIARTKRQTPIARSGARPRARARPEVPRGDAARGLDTKRERGRRTYRTKRIVRRSTRCVVPGRPRHLFRLSADVRLGQTGALFPAL